MPSLSCTSHVDEKNSLDAASYDENVQPASQQGAEAQQFSKSPSPTTPLPTHVPIPRQTSYNGWPATPMTAAASGPMSSAVTIPKRPKPGRKPIPEAEAADRRRTQNRNSQRQFRDRRAQNLSEALKHVSTLKADMDKKEAAWAVERDQMREIRQSLERALKAEQRKSAGLERRVQSLTQSHQGLSLPSIHRTSASNGPPATSPEVPPSYSHMEIDFTNFGRKPSFAFGSRSDSLGDDQIDFAMTHESCGFCTDEQNCQCRQTAAHSGPIEPPAQASGPGSCEACRTDPLKAQQCRDLAKQMSPPVGAQNNALALPPPRMSCSQMVDSFQKAGHQTTTISGLYRGQLTSYPSASGFGYDVDEHQAAEVLSNLKRRSVDDTSMKEH